MEDLLIPNPPAVVRKDQRAHDLIFNSPMDAEAKRVADILTDMNAANRRGSGMQLSSKERAYPVAPWDTYDGSLGEVMYWMRLGFPKEVGAVVRTIATEALYKMGRRTCEITGQHYFLDNTTIQLHVKAQSIVHER